MSKFASYDRIRAKIKFSKISPQPGPMARYLYRCFVTCELSFCADTARAAGVVTEGVPFIEWLRAVAARDFVRVVWANPFRYVSITEGLTLHEDFNQERALTCEVAKASDVRDLSARLSKLERAVERTARALNIPCDPPDYKAFYLALTDKEQETMGDML